MGVEDRFFAKVRVSGDCWLWTGRLDACGYGTFWIDGSVTRLAHRASLLIHGIDLVDGLQVDHLCHTADRSCSGGVTCLHRRCVNPAHLEQVPPIVNTLRGGNAAKTCCKRGHPFSDENTYLDGVGRRCRVCNKEAVRRYKQRKAVAA